MKIYKQISIIFFLCILGDIISKLFPFPFPGSVVAMILMFLLLLFKVIKTEQVEDASNYLTSILASLFVSTTVSIVQYVDVLKSVFFRFILICVLSSIITFAVTAFTVTFIIKLKERKEK